MTNFFRLNGALILLLVSLQISGQVKPEYLYNTAMPYGTLDIRIDISATEYYYLKENETFSYRESSPGVRSTKYRDMTTDWDSSPIEQGHLRRKTGSADAFVMNYRVLKPSNYDPDFEDGYPMILMMHGGYERGNCHYQDCYHSGWDYDPAKNIPAAPTSADSRLLNNDHNVHIGGRQHIDARNLAGKRLPNAPDLPARAFPGFVIIPQMLNDWDSVSVEHAIRIALLHTREYNINPNRVYIHGLSIGGHAVYQAIKRAPWLFAAALPISAVRDGYLVKQNLVPKIINIPIWIFQGEEDPRPKVEFTLDLIGKFRNAGATVRYTEYPDVGHSVWNKAYSEAEFFTFMLSKRKNNLYILKGITEIVDSANVFPKLMLPEGFFVYQWERDGQLIDEKSSILEVKIPGTYRARYSMVASPGGDQWNDWSNSVVITQAPKQEEEEEEEEEEEDGDGEEDGENGGEEEEEQDGEEDGEQDGEEDGEEEEEQDGEGEEDGEDEGENGGGGQDEEDDGEAEEDDSDNEGEEEEEVITGVENSTEGSVIFYPNPTRGDRISLRIPAHIRAEVNIRDAVGRIIHSGISDAQQGEIRAVQLGQPLQNGVYIFEVYENGNIHYQRIVIRNE